MRSASLIFCSALLTVVLARDPRHAGRAAAERIKRSEIRNKTRADDTPPSFVQREGETLVIQNANTTKFAVNGKAIPEVDFDIGESYAGLMPISTSATDNSTNQLYFWYFPTPNPAGKGDLTIWLNGGPGCSSLEGFLQENGPFLWNYGTFKPVKNPWTWINLSNMLWVEQPVGTGFSQGVGTETSQEMVAASFLGFLKNFIDTFGLHGKKIYIAGESYAGMYVPYIADAMFTAADKAYYDVRGTMIYDPSINNDKVMAATPAVSFVQANQVLFQLNDTYMETLQQTSKSCGYTDFLEEHLNFPAKKKLPSPPNTKDKKECESLWGEIKAAATRVNPCFNMYAIMTTCPLLWDVLGFPGSFEYLPQGATVYFNRTDVQKAINAPVGVNWAECSDVPLEKDSSEPSSFTVLPRVIEKSERTIIAHGSLDFILLAKGTLMSIQNMTWNGRQGFQEEPDDDLFIPYHKEYSKSTIAGSGVQGITHTERGLTWNEVFMSGHMVPQYAPSVAYRQMEFLLGRIKSLTERTSFTTQPGMAQPQVQTKGSGKKQGQGAPKTQPAPKNQPAPKEQETPKNPQAPTNQGAPKGPEAPKGQQAPKRGEDDDDDDDDDEDNDDED